MKTKNIALCLMIIIISSAYTFSQEYINFQGVARDGSGTLIKNQNISIRISIIEGGINYAALYTELHNIETTSNGLFILKIGNGESAGDFAEIDWANRKSKWFKTEIDINGGSDYINLGTTEFVSVPFAFYAQKAGSAAPTLPLMTTDERNALKNPPTGSMILNTNTWKINILKNDGWYELSDQCPDPTRASVGEDQLDVEGTFTELSGNKALEGLGTWSVISGVGGNFQNIHDEHTVFEGLAGTAYVLRWTIENQCNSYYADLNISFAESHEFECGDDLIDARDGQVYPTVALNGKCWMAKNINIGTQINSSLDPSDNGSIEKFCYEDSENLCENAGGLYTWDEAMGYSTVKRSQGICPDGWYIPSDSDWINMEISLGMEEGVANRANSWRGTDEGYQLQVDGGSGYNLQFGGRVAYGSFIGYGYYEFVWTSSSFEDNLAWRRCMRDESPQIGRYNTFPRNYGMSVRCIKNI